jgi:hypothetical protein
MGGHSGPFCAFAPGAARWVGIAGDAPDVRAAHLEQADVVLAPAGGQANPARTRLGVPWAQELG